MPTTWFLIGLTLQFLLGFTYGQRLIHFPYNQLGWIAVLAGMVLNLWAGALFNPKYALGLRSER